MSVDILLVLFVGITAVAMVLQTVFVVRTIRSGRALIEKTSKISDEIEAESLQLMDQLKLMGSSFEEMRRVFEAVGDRVDGVAQLVDTRVAELDRLAGRFVEIGERQADNLNEVVDDTLRKFRETTGIIQHDIVRPVVEISSLIKGVRTGLDYLIAGRKSSRKTPRYPEDELFI